MNDAEQGRLIDITIDGRRFNVAATRDPNRADICAWDCACIEILTDGEWVHWDGFISTLCESEEYALCSAADALMAYILSPDGDIR